MRHQTAAAMAAALASFLAMGCGAEYGKTPNVYPAHGKVVLPSGKAVTGAYIKFVPTTLEGVEAEAEIEEDGRFSLKAIGEKEGAVPGTYKVFLDVAAASPRPAAKTSLARRIIPRAYRKRDTTPLVAEVKAEPNHFTFTLR